MGGSDSAAMSLTYTAASLPSGLTISAGGLISGTPSAAGTFASTVTARDSTGACGSTTFSWVISSAGGCPSPGQKLGNAGFETGRGHPVVGLCRCSRRLEREAAHSGVCQAWLNDRQGGLGHAGGVLQPQQVHWIRLESVQRRLVGGYDGHRLLLRDGGLVPADVVRDRRHGADSLLSPPRTRPSREVQLTPKRCCPSR